MAMDLHGVRNFDRLLARLHPDRQQAGEKYESIRKNLIGYFLANAEGDPAELADCTLDRVADRLDEARDLLPFLRGVARNVALETRHQRRYISLDRIYPNGNLAAEAQESECHSGRAECLALCLEALPDADRDLLLEYYRYQGAEKIENRRRLATVLHTSVETLTVRAFRARARLRSCSNKCMRANPTATLLKLESGHRQSERSDRI